MELRMILNEKSDEQKEFYLSNLLRNGEVFFINREDYTIFNELVRSYISLNYDTTYQIKYEDEIEIEARILSIFNKPYYIEKIKQENSEDIEANILAIKHKPKNV